MIALATVFFLIRILVISLTHKELVLEWDKGDEVEFPQECCAADVAQVISRAFGFYWYNPKQTENAIFFYFGQITFKNKSQSISFWSPYTGGIRQYLHFVRKQKCK